MFHQEQEVAPNFLSNAAVSQAALKVERLAVWHAADTDHREFDAHRVAARLATPLVYKTAATRTAR